MAAASAGEWAGGLGSGPDGDAASAPPAGVSDALLLFNYVCAALDAAVAAAGGGARAAAAGASADNQGFTRTHVVWGAGAAPWLTEQAGAGARARDAAAAAATPRFYLRVASVAPVFSVHVLDASSRRAYDVGSSGGGSDAQGVGVMPSRIALPRALAAYLHLLRTVGGGRACGVNVTAALDTLLLDGARSGGGTLAAGAQGMAGAAGSLRALLRRAN
jgi:hypothetical protein